jgi:hypothetical protein
MFADLRGAVEQYKFSPSKQRLLPLFEGIANSLQSIYLSETEIGEIRIKIERDKSQTALEFPEYAFSPIENISITDNGNGFTDENYNSFSYLYTQIKKEMFGCKGVGRIIWFKTFEHVEVNSTYSTDTGLKNRIFRQTVNDDLPQGGKPKPFPRGKIETTVHLMNSKEIYRKCLNIKLETIKKEVIQHFFPHLLLFAACPKIIIQDEKDLLTIDSSDLPKPEKRDFKIGDQEFSILHVKNTHSEDKKHRIFYCADRRVVKTEGIPNFTKRKIDNMGEEFYYEGYVSSVFLDSKGDNERGSFFIDELSVEERVASELGWPDIQQGCSQEVKDYLSSHIERLENEKESRITEVLNSEMPNLSYLKQESKEQIEKISVDASKEKIREELNLMHAKNKASSYDELNKLINRIELQKNNVEQFSKFAESYREEISKLNEINKADLASYVIYRKKILDIFNALISKFNSKEFDPENGIQDSETRIHEYEAGIHSLIFPRFKDSENAQNAYDEHNLWVIDDRWSFYDYAASDKSLKNHKRLYEVESGGEPDIALYNVGFTEDMDDANHSNIVLLEFKRPGKERFGKEDPLEQVLEYIEKIREGKIETYNGRKLKVQESTSFYAYIICEVSESYRQRLTLRNDFQATTDNSGLFRTYGKGYNAYVEFLPFEKILSDARKRNEVFFKKLGIHKSS